MYFLYVELAFFMYLSGISFGEKQIDILRNIFNSFMVQNLKFRLFCLGLYFIHGFMSLRNMTKSHPHTIYDKVVFDDEDQ